jgi:hypothetical protein
MGGTMKNYVSVFLILSCLLINSNAQGQNFLESMLAEAEKSEQLRLSKAPKLAPTLIPKAKTQSQLGSYLIGQLSALEEGEESKKKAKKMRSKLKKIKKDLGKLNSRISSWEIQDYSADLSKSVETFAKHLKTHSDLIEVERDRLAAAERAEQDRVAAVNKAKQNKIAARKKAEKDKIAARKKAEKDKIAAYETACEGESSDDPFAAFDEPDTGDRLRLTAEIDSKKIKLQATTEGCLWEEDPNDSSILPKLIASSLFKHNPKNTSQFIYSGLRDGNLILDFTKYRCLSQKKDGTQQTLACYDSASANIVKTSANVGNTSGSKTVKPTSSNPQVSCGSLYSEFEANEARTLNKYKNKTVIITGKVTGIDSDLFDNPVISLSSNRDDWGISDCTLSPSSKNLSFVYDLNKGQTVKLKCSDIGEVMGFPQAKNCMLAN